MVTPLRSCFRRFGFTLVEMLAVIVIMGLLIGLAIPSITRLAKSGNLSSATTQIANTLDLARQYAITKRTTTRFVFCENLSGFTLSNTHWFTAFSVMALTNSASPTNISSWANITKWDYVPEGTVIRSMWSNPSNRALLPNPTNFAAGATLTYIQFSPTGAAASWGGPTPRVILWEGFYDPGVAVLLIRRTSSNVTTCTVDTVLGRVKVNR